MWWHLILVDDLCDDISNQVAWGFHVAIAGATGVGNGNASSRIIRQYSGAQDNAAELGCIDVVVGLFLGFHIGIPDRKSTRLNSSHVSISYAVFCLKQKTNV